MRITNKMMSNNFLADMKVNLENLNRIQEQNTSGKKFKRPSDDPFAVARSMQLHSDINVNKQYSKDITDVSNWLDTTDTALGQGGDVLQRVRELLISSGNGAYGPAERRAIKDEINEKIGEFAQILNTSFEGNYIFGGTRSTTKPVSVVDGSSLGNSCKSGTMFVDKTGKNTPSIVNQNGNLNGDVNVNIKFTKIEIQKVNGVDTPVPKEIKMDIKINKDTSIESLSDLAEKANKQINQNKEFKGKIKAVPNIRNNNIMFVNIDKVGKNDSINEFDINGTISSININGKSAINKNNAENTRIMYFQKQGGELVDGPQYEQIKSDLKVQVAQGVTMDYSISASKVLEFKDKNGQKLDIRELFDDITNHLDGKNDEGVNVDDKSINKLITGDLKNITDAINNVLKIRSEVGARQNRMEGASERNKDGTFNMTKILSKHEDVNYTEGMTNFATTLSVYMASLQTSAKIIQPTLMDYLR